MKRHGIASSRKDIKEFVRGKRSYTLCKLQPNVSRYYEHVCYDTWCEKTFFIDFIVSNSEALFKIKTIDTSDEKVPVYSLQDLGQQLSESIFYGENKNRITENNILLGG